MLLMGRNSQGVEWEEWVKAPSRKEPKDGCRLVFRECGEVWVKMSLQKGKKKTFTILLERSYKLIFKKDHSLQCREWIQGGENDYWITVKG